MVSPTTTRVTRISSSPIFISGRRFWQRKDITLSFVVKREFSDSSEESLMFMTVEPDMNFDSISKLILGDVSKVRKEHSNDLDGTMEFVGKLPRFVLEILMWVLSRMEYHGVYPQDLAKGDPNYTTCLLSNLGSIGADSCYHHLSNFGTNSMMGTIGTIYHDETDNRDKVEMTITIDERIADGFYFAKSLKLLKYFLEHPQTLMEKVSDPVPQDIAK